MKFTSPDFLALVAPRRTPRAPARVKVFLAGSIDMGLAVEWQDQVIEELRDLPITLFNPRRPDFDATLEQDITNYAFAEQVNWELDHLDQSNIVLVYFDPKGKAPVTLMELGLHIASKRMVVCCPPGYWRRGNVQIICDRFNVLLVDSLDEFLVAARAEIQRHLARK